MILGGCETEEKQQPKRKLFQNIHEVKSIRTIISGTDG